MFFSTIDWESRLRNLFGEEEDIKEKKKKKGNMMILKEVPL